MHDVLMSGFAMMFFQDPSIPAFQTRLQESSQQNNLAGVFGVVSIPKDTQMRDIIDIIPTDAFSHIFPEFLNRLQRSRQLDQYRFMEGKYLVPLDGAQYFSSANLSCPYCLKTESAKGLRYHHQILQAVIVHPDIRQVIPLFPESIQNTDGYVKQDCEITGMGESEQLEFCDSKGKHHKYQWINDVPLNGLCNAEKVNFFQYWMTDKKGKTTCHNRWVTDMTVSRKNVRDLVRGGRARWKIENETFNTLKNQGYHIEHNYGHGKQHLSMNFFVLNLLAFFIHQVLELCDHSYQRARSKFSSRKEYWNQLRCTFRIILFQDLYHLLDYIFDPPMLRAP